MTKQEYIARFKKEAFSIMDNSSDYWAYKTAAEHLTNCLERQRETRWHPLFLLMKILRDQGELNSVYAFREFLEDFE